MCNRLARDVHSHCRMYMRIHIPFAHRPRRQSCQTFRYVRHTDRSDCCGYRPTSPVRAEEATLGPCRLSTDRAMKRVVDRDFVIDLGLPVEFPTTYFPGPIEQYRQDLIRQTTIPGDFAAAGMLAALSVGVGNSVVGRLGTKRFIPASLYLLLIGDPGSGKSPALANTLEAIRREQAARVQAAFQSAGACRQRQVVDISGSGLTDVMCFDGLEDGDADGDAADSTAPSPVRHLHLTDATIAGVREALMNNPRGVVVAADEAVGLFKGPGKGSDRATWLEMWNADGLAVSRRSGKPPILMIPRCFVTVIAGTQPDIVPALRNSQGDDGLFDRLLIFGDKVAGWPRYSHCQTDVALAAVYNGAIDRLLQHRDDGGSNATGAAAVLPISDAASRVFEECHNHVVTVFERARAARRYGGLITKMIANATRLAVLRACSCWAVQSPANVVSPTEVTEEDAREACNVALFSLGRALLWRPELVDSASTPGAPPAAGMPTSVWAAGTAAEVPEGLPQRILDYMGRRGLAEVRIGKLHSSGGFGAANSHQLRAACDALVDAGRAQWRDNRKSLFGLLANDTGLEGESR